MSKAPADRRPKRAITLSSCGDVFVDYVSEGVCEFTTSLTDESRHR